MYPTLSAVALCEKCDYKTLKELSITAHFLVLWQLDNTSKISHPCIVSFFIAILRGDDIRNWQARQPNKNVYMYRHAHCCMCSLYVKVIVTRARKIYHLPLTPSLKWSALRILTAKKAWLESECTRKSQECASLYNGEWVRMNSNHRAYSHMVVVTLHPSTVKCLFWSKIW